MLSDHTTTQLRAALREHCSDAIAARDQVRAAINGAASEARKQGLRAEQFVIWIKRVWDEIMDEGWLANDVNPARARDMVISSAIRAYYVQ